MGVGFGELIVILLIVLVVFGAGRLPQIGDALGRSIRNFKKATSGEEIDVTPKREELPSARTPTSAEPPRAETHAEARSEQSRS